METNLKKFSYAQIAVCAFIGTPAAALFLAYLNIKAERRGWEFQSLIPLLVIVIFYVIAFSGAKWVSVFGPLLFLMFSVAALLLNYVTQKNKSEGRSGWWPVIGISAAFLLAYMAAVVLLSS